MKIFALIISLAVLSGCSTAKKPLAIDAVSPWPDRACPASQPAADEVVRRNVALKTAILSAVQTSKPHAPAIDTHIFTGNYDWHSAVHGHWALLSMARVNQDQELKTWVLNRLNTEALIRERNLLNEPKNSKFEMPYGQSWLLLLLDEMVANGEGNRPEVVGLQQDTYKRILNWLETSRFPDGVKPGQTFRGDHYSWLFSFWLTQMSHPGAEALKRLEALRIQKIEPVRAQIPDNPALSTDFLYIPAVLALVDLTSGRQATQLARIYRVQKPISLNTPIVQGNAHTAGAAMVRIWPYALPSSKDPTSCSRFNTRLSEMFSRPDQWRDGFETVSHWVPQFMWMGMLLAHRSEG